MLEPTPLYGGNAEFLDALYEQYLRDPASVEERWRTYFTQLAPAEAAGPPRGLPPHPARTAQPAPGPPGARRRGGPPPCARSGPGDGHGAPPPLRETAASLASH